jgi:(4S)-4-hydroxy-5-phosphonooxypentane-2,3-dione isomerase
MSKFATVGTIDVAPGRREELLHLLMAHRARCLNDEPGTLQMEFMVPRDDKTKVLLFEVYRDDAAFDTHARGASFARWRKESGEMVTKLHVTRCAVAE